MDISCSFGRIIHRAGGLVVVHLKGSAKNRCSKDAVILAQAHGYIHVDSKWMRGNADLEKLIIQTTQSAVFQKVQIPKSFPLFSNSTYCTFLTSKEVIQVSHLCNDGVFLQFELPHDAYPSFKGLSVTIQYLITISIQLPTGTKYVHFPFRVSSRGFVMTTTSLTPQYIKFSAMSVYSPACLPPEARYLPTTTSESDEARNTCADSQLFDAASHTAAATAVANINNIYAIRGLSDEPLCTMRLLTPSNTTMGDEYMSSNATATAAVGNGPLRPGQTLVISLQFHPTRGEGSRSYTCRMVRGVLLQHEQSAEGARIQDRQVDTSSRTCDHALLVNLRLSLPELFSADFKCPVVQVHYTIVLEFFLQAINQSTAMKNTDVTDVEPLTWSLEVPVLPLGSPAQNALAEAMACLEPALEWHSSNFGTNNNS